MSAVMQPGGAPMPSPMLPKQPSYVDPRQTGLDYVWYASLVQGLSSVAPNGASQVQIDAGSDFYWIASSFQADIAGAAQTESSVVVPLVTVLVNDSGSQRNLTYSPVPLSSISGPGERPYRLPMPRLIRANGIVNFTWVSYVAAGTTYTNIYFILHGFRLPVGQPWPY